MRKVYTFLASAVLFAVGAVSAQAQKYYDVPGFENREFVTEITPGQQVVLHTASAGTPNYLSGSVKSATAGENAVYAFEEAGADSKGVMTYYLKQVNTGKYLEDPQYASGVEYVSSTAKAFRFYAKHPENFYYKGETVPSDADVTTTAVYDSAHYNKVKPEGAYIFTNVDYANKPINADNKVYFSPWWPDAKTAAFWGYQDTNTWYVYTVTAKAGSALLEAVITDLFPSGTSELYPTGENVGCVSEAQQNAMKAAYDAAVNQLNNGATDATACEQKAAELKTAYEAYIAARIPMKAGYYVFTSTGRGASAGIYEKDKALYWMNWEVPTTYTIADAAYIWKVSAAEDKDTYRVQNFLSKNYASNVQTSTLVQTVAENAPAYKFVSSALDASKFAIGPVKTGTYGFLHEEGGSGKGRIVGWEAASEPSAWTIIPVADAVITALESQVKAYNDSVAQAQLNVNFKKLYNNAAAAYTDNNFYKLTSGQNLSADGSTIMFDDPGSATDASQFSSNAKEASEGTFEGLIDGIATATSSQGNNNWYFHTAWKGTIAEPHYLQVELPSAIQNPLFQFAKRTNASYNHLRSFRLEVSNDTTAGWTDAGVFGVNYNRTGVVGNDTVKNAVALVGANLSAAYKFFRIVCLESTGSQSLNGYDFFHIGELRIYDGATVDAAKSINSVLDATAKNNLNNQMTAALALINAGTAVTQAQYDALKAAYDAYVAAVPNKSKLTSAIAEAKAQAAAAAEGEGLGFFEVGAGAQLTAAAEAVANQVSDDVMTAAQIQSLTEQLNTAVAAFNAKLHMPENGKYYYIKCATSGEAANNYVYTTDNSKAQIRWGGFDASKGKDAHLSDGARLNFIWKAVKNGPSSYSFMNAATGTYMATQPTNNMGMFMRLDADSSAMNLRSAKVGGLFNFVQADNVFANAKPGTKTVVTWNSASGTDNSAFFFEEATDWNRAYYLNMTSPAIVTLPFDVLDAPEGGKIYLPLGLNKTKGTMEFAEVSASVPAGTPLLVVPNAGEEGVEISLSAASLEAINYTLTPVTYTNATTGAAFAGTLAPVALPATAVVLNAQGTTFLKAEKDATSRANDGYFTNLGEFTGNGDYSVNIDPDLVTGINSAVLNVVKSGKIYDLQGREVQKAQKGLYIINGKKVLVK